MGWTRGRRGDLNHLRVAPRALAAVAVLPLLLTPAAATAAAGTGPAGNGPAGGVSWQAHPDLVSAVVPDVLGRDVDSARAILQAAGFAVQAVPGFVDCGLPYVQQQTPAGGSSAPAGSTVRISVNRQPGPGQACP